MMDNTKIDRINTLAHKAKSVGLTEEEIQDAIKERLPEKFHALNYQALQYFKAQHND